MPRLFVIHQQPRLLFCNTGNILNCLQILVELADLQDQEVGDGTTSVVILAAELLKRANDLVRCKIHPTSIISGYRLAMREVSPLCAAGQLTQGLKRFVKAMVLLLCRSCAHCV